MQTTYSGLRKRITGLPAWFTGLQTEFSGDVLQRVRQALRLELKDIATRTKIGLSQLRAIEGELWDALPAQVYLRGFLQEYAKCLRLDSAQVVRSYLERYQRARGLEPAERRN